MKDLLRIFIYVFFPNRCWECFAHDEVVQVRDYYDEQWGLVEAQWVCRECEVLVAEMSYSPSFPNHPMTIMGRIQFLQEEMGKEWAFVLKGEL